MVVAAHHLKPSSSSLSYDVAQVRADFPILSMRPYDKPLVYFDNAASAQKPRPVLDRMMQAYTQDYANVHRGLHFLANQTTEAFEQARITCQKFLGASLPEEIIFTRSATESLNLIAASFGLDHIQAGDEIVLSVLEHHSNIVPWHFLRERKGAVLKWIEVDEEGNFSLESFQKALSPKTKIVAITHMSNVLGTITPIKDIVQIAHAHHIPVVVDGSQAAVHLPIDVQDLECDFYAFTGHKLYGPTGIGVLYGKKKWLEHLPPFQGGGEMVDYVTRDHVTYEGLPHRFEAGTPPIVQAIGLAAAIDYVTHLGREAILAHEIALFSYAREALGSLKNLRFLGKPTHAGALISFNLQGAHAHDVATLVDRQGIALRAGTHCALPLLQSRGETASCRASFALYNQKEEIDMLVKALNQVTHFFA